MDAKEFVNLSSSLIYLYISRIFISVIQDEAEIIDENDEQQFLACADYLSNYGLLSLISNTEAVTSEVLKGYAFRFIHV